SIAHGAASIHDETAPQIGIGLKFLDKKSIRAPKNAPIQASKVVSRNVFPILGKFNAGPAMRAGVSPRDISKQRPASKQRHIRQARQDLGVQETSRIARRNHSSKFQEPRTKNQEPRTKNQEPRTKNQEPRTKNQQRVRIKFRTSTEW